MRRPLKVPGNGTGGSMKTRPWSIWATLAVIAGLISLYAWAGPLFATQTEGVDPSWTELDCGSLNDIWHYSKNLQSDVNFPPWAGPNDTAVPEPDVLFRDSCNSGAAIAQTILIVSAPIFVGLTAAAVVMAIRRRKNRSAPPDQRSPAAAASK
jgi:hypothetical protein